MKPISAELIFEDYNKVMRQEMENNDYFRNQEIESIFSPESDNYSLLANSYGAIAKRKYVDYVTELLFPQDGSWLLHSGKKSEERHKADMYLRTKFSNSNFYKEIQKMIDQGVMFNRGLISLGYGNGLDFKSIKEEDIFVSEGFSESDMRVYAKRFISVQDLIERFGGEIVDKYEQECAEGGMNSEIQIKMLTLVECVLPLSKRFFENPKSKYKYKKVYLLVDDGESFIVTQKGDSEESCYYVNFPIMVYLPAHVTSLANEALVPAVQLNQYETLLANNARKVNAPTFGIAESLFNDGIFNLDEFGSVPVAANEVFPKPIESMQRMMLTETDLRRQMEAVNEVFEVELIKRVNTINVSQFELASNQLNAIKAVVPAAADLATRVPQVLLKRAQALLRQNDSEYRKLLAAAGDKEVVMVGLAEKIRRLEIAVGLGRLAQGATPYMQVDPQARSVIDASASVRAMAEAWGVGFVLNSDEEVLKQLAADEQAMQEAQQGEDTKNQADITKTLAEAQAIQQGQ